MLGLCVTLSHGPGDVTSGPVIHTGIHERIEGTGVGVIEDCIRVIRVHFEPVLLDPASGNLFHIFSGHGTLVVVIVRASYLEFSWKYTTKCGVLLTKSGVGYSY
jgi:hypothetical protein